MSKISRTVYHPGSYIRDVIDELGMSQHEFAKRLQTTDKTLSQLLSGDINLSVDLADKLSKLLNTSYDVWMNLQVNYDNYLLSLQEEEVLKQEKKYYETLDYSYFVYHHHLEKIKDWRDRIKQLRKLLNVSNLSVLNQEDLFVHCRTSSSNIPEQSVIRRNAWITIGMNIVKQQSVETFNKIRLKEIIKEFRKMSLTSPINQLSQIETMLNNCGVHFLLLPYMKNSNINGVVKWLDSEHAMMLMNTRSNYCDVFWFSFFHEIAHIFQEKKRVMIMSDCGSELEKDADEYAKNILIPKKMFDNFVSEGNFDRENIISFATKIQIHPGCIVGRLQNENIIGYAQFNDLRLKVVED